MKRDEIRIIRTTKQAVVKKNPADLIYTTLVRVCGYFRRQSIDHLYNEPDRSKY